MKKWLSYMLVLILFVLPGNVFAVGTQPFSDVKESDWFYKDVLEMNALGVVSGYEDYTFKPRDHVKKIEAIAMVLRHMGLKDEAEQVTEQEKAFYIPRVGLKAEDVSPWAQGYLVQAVKMGWVQPSTGSFDWSGKASREWVAQLLIRAIGKEGDALTQRFNRTSFADDSKIGYDYRGYVNAAVQFELVYGYTEDNTFRPDQSVTRAEMAALLKRLNPYLPVNPNVINGVIVDKIGTQIVIEDEQGKQTTLSVDNNTVIFSNKEKLSYVNLKSKDQVKVIKEGTRAKFIDRLAENVEIHLKATGKVYEHSKDKNLIILEKSDGQLLTLTYDEKSQVLIDNQWKTGISTYDLTDLEADVTYTKENKLLNIIPKNYGSKKVVQGVIYDINLAKKLIILEKGDGTLESFTYADTTVIEYSGQRFATIENLRKGDRIEVDLGKNPVDKIKVLVLNQSQELQGTVQAINPEQYILTIQTAEGIKAYYVSKDATIILRGLNKPELRDLELGDQVKIQTNGDKITRLEVLNRSYETEVKGKLVSYDRQQQVITLEDNSGKLIAKKWANNVVLLHDGERISWDDLEKGYPVKLVLRKDLVTSIELDTVVIGKILSFDEDARLITIDTEEGEKTYSIDSGADVEIFDERNADLDDLEKGQTIKAKTDLDGNIEEIKVQTGQLFELVDVRESYEDLKVKDQDGDTHYIDYTDETRLINPKNPDFDWEDLKEGDKIWLSFWGEDLYEVITAETYIGKVVSLDHEDKEITLEVDGTRKTAKVDDLSNIKIGDYLRVEQVGEKAFVQRASSGEAIVSYVDDDHQIYISEGTSKRWITLDENVLVKRGNLIIDYMDLKPNEKIRYYHFGGKVIVIEVQ